MDILSKLALYSIKASTAEIIMLVAVFGIVFFDRKTLIRAIILLAFSLILNRFLKMYLQVPLPPGIPGDYAMPSGHMQSAVVFYGWIAFATRSKLAYLAFIIFMGFVGTGTVLKGYHYPADIWSAFAVGTALIGTYLFVQSKYLNEKTEPYAAPTLALLGLALLLAKVPAISSYAYLYGIIAGLVAVAIAWKAHPKREITSIPGKIVLLVWIVCGCVLVHYCTNLLAINAIAKSAIVQFFGALWLIWLAEASLRKLKLKI